MLMHGFSYGSVLLCLKQEVCRVVLYFKRSQDLSVPVRRVGSTGVSHLWTTLSLHPFKYAIYIQYALQFSICYVFNIIILIIVLLNLQKIHGHDSL